MALLPTDWGASRSSYLDCWCLRWAVWWQHSPQFYGKVLFLTPDGNRMRWVNDDGSLGAVLDFDDMQSALGRLAETRPAATFD